MSVSAAIKAEAPPASTEDSHLKKMINGGTGGSLTPPSPLEATVKGEPSRIMSPNTQAASASTNSENDQKRIQNNNTSSYTSGGRLKFFKGKRIFDTLLQRNVQLRFSKPFFPRKNNSWSLSAVADGLFLLAATLKIPEIPIHWVFSTFIWKKNCRYFISFKPKILLNKQSLSLFFLKWKTSNRFFW